MFWWFDIREYCNSIGQKPQNYETYELLPNEIAALSDIEPSKI